MSSSAIPLFGHAWELSVYYGDDPTPLVVTSNKWEPEALWMKFDVLLSAIPSPFWSADITIYNLNDPAVQNLILTATRVVLKAGFQNGPNLYSTIWDGPVLQAILTREAVVDLALRLHCIASPAAIAEPVSLSVGPYSSQQQLLAKMAQAVGVPQLGVANGTLSDAAQQALSTTQYPRGNTVFGTTAKQVALTAYSHFLQSWQDGNKAYISEMANPSLTPALIYSPPFAPNVPVSNLPANTTFSIVGTPRQLPQGVEFSVLLDPRLQVKLPPMVVELTNTLVTLEPLTQGQSFVAPLSSLTFFVGQVRHSGDTRGNLWQTDVIGFSTVYAQNLPDGLFSGGG